MTSFEARVADRADSLTPRERAVTDFLLSRPAEAVTASAAELAELAGTSDATVVRTARSLGFAGLRDLKRSLLAMLTARRDPAAVLDQRLERLGSGAVVDHVLADSVDLLRAVRQELDPQAWARAIDLLDRARRIVAYGIGPAASAAGYLALGLTRLGHPANAVETTGFRLADDLLNLAADDVLVIHAPLRLFREIEVLLDHATAIGAAKVVITESLTEALRDRADAVLTTPPSTTSSAGENLAGWVLAHAIVMELGTHNRSGSVATRQRLSKLRHDITGADLGTATTATEATPAPRADTHEAPPRPPSS